MKVLIVEDNPLLAKSVKFGLEESGFTIDLARDGEEGLYFAMNGEYHVLVLDRLLPKLSGIDLIAKLRQAGNLTPIIMVTARSSVEDRITGLDVGADDYLTKPFDMGELVARLHALNRRALGRGTTALMLGRLKVERTALRASVGDAVLEFTSKEFDILACLIERANQVVSRQDLVSLLYELNEEPESNSLNVLMTRLRKKLSASGVVIETIRNQGFMMKEGTPT